MRLGWRTAGVTVGVIVVGGVATLLVPRLWTVPNPDDSSPVGQASRVNAQREAVSPFSTTIAALANHATAPLVSRDLDALLSNTRGMTETKAVAVEEIEILDMQWLDNLDLPVVATARNGDRPTIDGEANVRRFLFEAIVNARPDVRWVPADDSLELKAFSDEPGEGHAVARVTLRRTSENASASLARVWADELNVIGARVADAKARTQRLVAGLHD